MLTLGNLQEKVDDPKVRKDLEKVLKVLPLTFLATSYATTSKIPGVKTEDDVATAILETGWFESKIYKRANNPWGVKASSTDEGKQAQDGVYVADDGLRYAKYNNLTRAFLDRVRILEWYKTRADWIQKSLETASVESVCLESCERHMGWSPDGGSKEIRSKAKQYIAILGNHINAGRLMEPLAWMDLWWAPLQSYYTKVTQLKKAYSLHLLNDSGDSYEVPPELDVSDDEEYKPGPDNGIPDRKTGYGERGPSMWAIVIPLVLGLVSTGFGGVFSILKSVLAGGKVGGIFSALKGLFSRLFKPEIETALRVEEESLLREGKVTGPEKLARALEELGVDANQWWVKVAVALINFWLGSKDWSNLFDREGGEPAEKLLH